MGSRIVAVIVLLALCAGGYYYYEHQKEQRRLDSGDVQCIGCDSPEQHARFLKENSGETADGNSEHKQQTARQAAADIAAGDVTAGTPGYNSVNRDTPGGTGPVVNSTVPVTTLPANTGTAGMQTYAAAPPAAAGTGVSAPPPAYDSQLANNPNGSRFGGNASNGSYQWYRQGNLTYRVDTATGRSCVAYATMEEWRKQVVMSHGCGRTS